MLMWKAAGYLHTFTHTHTHRKLVRMVDGSRWPLQYVEGLLFCAVYDQPQNIQAIPHFPLYDPPQTSCSVLPGMTSCSV